MSNTTPDTPEQKFVWVLRCPCGDVLKGASEDEIVDLSFAHLKDKHPDMAEAYEREHILFMAIKFLDTGD